MSNEIFFMDNYLNKRKLNKMLKENKSFLLILGYKNLSSINLSLNCLSPNIKKSLRQLLIYKASVF